MITNLGGSYPRQLLKLVVASGALPMSGVQLMSAANTLAEAKAKKGQFIMALT